MKSPAGRRPAASPSCAGFGAIGPLIALAIVSLVFLLTFVPGVLVYPAPSVPAPASPDSPVHDELAEAYLRSEETLGRHADELGTYLDGGVCIADGRFVSEEGGEELDVGGALAAAPDLAVPLPSAIPDDITFDGTLAEWLRGAVTLVGSPGDASGAGIGVYVGPTLLLTSSSLLGGDTGTVRVSDAGGGALDGQVLAVEHGLAAVRVSERAGQGHFVTATIEPGQAATATGLLDPANAAGTTGPTFAINTGIVTALVDGEARVGAVYHSAPLTSGFAGAPLSDGCGRLVGIHAADRASYFPERVIGRALDAATVARFLSNNELSPPASDSSVCRFEIAGQSADD